MNPSYIIKLRLGKYFLAKDDKSYYFIGKFYPTHYKTLIKF